MLAAEGRFVAPLTLKDRPVFLDMLMSAVFSKTECEELLHTKRGDAHRLR